MPGNDRDRRRAGRRTGDPNAGTRAKQQFNVYLPPALIRRTKTRRSMRGCRCLGWWSWRSTRTSMLLSGRARGEGAPDPLSSPTSTRRCTSTLALGLEVARARAPGSWIELRAAGGELGLHDGPSAADGEGRAGVMLNFVRRRALGVMRVWPTPGSRPQDERRSSRPRAPRRRPRSVIVQPELTARSP